MSQQLIKRIKKDYDIDFGYKSDEELLAELRKEGLPSLAKLLKMIKNKWK